MIIATLNQLEQIAKAHIIDAIRKAGGGAADIIRAADTLTGPDVKCWGYTWRFDGGTVDYHAALDEWTTTLEETCQEEKEDSPSSIPTSLASETKPLATSPHDQKSNVTTTPVSGFA